MSTFLSKAQGSQDREIGKCVGYLPPPTCELPSERPALEQNCKRVARIIAVSLHIRFCAGVRLGGWSDHLGEARGLHKVLPSTSKAI